MHQLGELLATSDDPISIFGETLSHVLRWLLETVRSIDPGLRIPLAGLAIMFETTLFLGLLIPGDAIVVIAAIGTQGPIEYLALVVAVIIGAIAGESVGFLLGHHFGPRIRSSRLGRRLGEKQWQRAESYIDRRGGIAVFVSRFLPILHALVPVTVGMSSLSYRRFIAWTVPACAVWSIAYVSVGTFAAGSFTALLERLHYAGYLFVGIVLLFGAVSYGVKRILQRHHAMHTEALTDHDEQLCR